jgi:16S rRNA (uracil1498-N3)-methyltransferase
MRQSKPIKREHNDTVIECHEFAFFYPRLGIDIPECCVGTEMKLTDVDLFHRISRVVRLRPGQFFVLFDRTLHVRLELRAFDARSVVVVVHERGTNLVLVPHITFALPLLKRDHFQDALYSLAELGANVVQPIVTQKTQRAWGGEHEYERVNNIMIAAAEQSKHFSFPELKNTQDFTVWCHECSKTDSVKIFFDTEGESVAVVVEHLRQRTISNLVLVVGPEGDLTDQEKKLLRENGFTFCALTPTVLRANQAVAVAMGIIRSCLR